MQKIHFRFTFKCSILLIGLMLNLLLLAQSQQPSLYIQRYVKTGDTTHLKSSLNKINSEFVRYNSKELVLLLKKAVKKAERQSYPELAMLYSLVRQYYTFEGNRAKTLEYSLKQYKALSSRGNSDELLWILIDIGNLFYDEREFDQALNFYQKAEMIGLKQDNASQLAVVYLNFGLVYQERKDFANALKYLHKSSAYRIQDKDLRMAGSTFVRIADAHIQLQQSDSAYKYIRLAEDFYYGKNESAEELMTEIPMYIEMAWFAYYGLIRNHSLALAHFGKAQQYARKYKLNYDYYSNIFFEAKYYLDKGEYRTAANKWLSTLPFFKKHHLLDEQRYIYRMAGQTYLKLNETAEASKYLHMHLVLDDSIKKSSAKSDLQLMRTIAAVYESDAALQRTKKNLQIEKINAQLRVKERNASVWIAALALFGIMILLGLFFNLRKNRRALLSLHTQLKTQNREIKINAMELERTNKIKDKLFSIIAHDLRNPLNRLLAELSIAKKRNLEDHSLDPMEVTLKETINLFEGLLQWAKLDNNHNIYSPTKVSLGENINKIIGFYLPDIQSKNIRVVNNSAAVTAFADRNILQTILRNIMSNAIASISKQRDEGTISIETSVVSEDMISVFFHDSGSGFPQEILDGFDDENITNGKGLGLSICKMLAKMSGWTMQISNESDLGGAKIMLVLPAFRNEEVGDVDLLPLSKNWRSKFSEVRNFKFYQTSEIRKFLKSCGEVDDRNAALWIAEMERCVHEGDEVYYAELLKMLEDHGDF